LDQQPSPNHSIPSAAIEAVDNELAVLGPDIEKNKTPWTVMARGVKSVFFLFKRRVSSIETSASFFNGKLYAQQVQISPSLIKLTILVAGIIKDVLDLLRDLLK
jgi:hypothetical protein